MITTTLTAGILTAIGLAFIAMKFGNNFVRKLLGYSWAVDVLATLSFMWLFAISGTISGMMTGIIAGLMVSIMLWVAKQIMGVRKLQKDENGNLRWTNTKGAWESKVREVFGTEAFIPATCV
jgi:hypothetical protein